MSSVQTSTRGKQKRLFSGMKKLKIAETFSEANDVSIANEDCLKFLKTVPDSSAKLVITSPPYNIGKSYEKKLKLEDYVAAQEQVIDECVRILDNVGSICWQVGNYVSKGEIIPLDTMLYPVFLKHSLKLRNRIVWHFEHGLHCSKRFSGRYETVIWFTKSDDYIFNLDPVRVPQKYPGKKYFKGPKAGKYSCNPLGKNPGDLWVIPNVKSNHVEKTIHPCQFPVELIERFVLSLTDPGDLVVDPFMGVASTSIAALKHQRRAAGAELSKEFFRVGMERVGQFQEGSLRIRQMNKPVHVPSGSEKVARNPFVTT